MTPIATLPEQIGHDGNASVETYSRTGDPRARERAIEHFMPLARKVALRYRRGAEPLDDLVQVAYLGLVKAVDRFDHTRGSRFATYAVPTISGELRRHFRDTTWTLHVPRGVQEATLDLARATDLLTHRLGHAPTVSELSAETGLDAEQITEALHAKAVQDTLPFDRARNPANEAAGTIGDAIGEDDDRFALIDDKLSVRPLLRDLPGRDREILAMRFVRDMTQSQIAERIGCSQMQVSRILRRILNQLAERADELPAALATELDAAHNRA